MNEKNFEEIIQDNEEKIEKKHSIENAKMRISDVENYIKDIGNQIPREDAMKYENDIIFEIMPSLEERKKKIAELLDKNKKRISKQTDPELIEFYQESLNSDSKEMDDINKEIEKYQELLNHLKK